MTNEFKEALIKMIDDRGKNMGIDLDGDTIIYDGKKYYVDCIRRDVTEV